MTQIVHYLHCLLTAAVMDVSLLGSNGFKRWAAKHEAEQKPSHGEERLALLDHKCRPLNNRLWPHVD